MARLIVRTAFECQAVASRAPFAWTVARVAALLAGAEVMHGGRHGDGEAERELAADVSDVVDGPSWHPHDVVLARFQNNAARQFPREQGGGPICATTSAMRVCSTLGHVTFVGVG